MQCPLYSYIVENSEVPEWGWEGICPGCHMGECKEVCPQIAINEERNPGGHWVHTESVDYVQCEACGGYVYRERGEVEWKVKTCMLSATPIVTTPELFANPSKEGGDG
jgi:hypothetical protein